jgi:methionyl-tRNA synthetase
MSKNNNVFLTCTLPYCNSIPHVGTMFEFLLGDATTRYLRTTRHDVHFNLGIDENGLKILNTANELGITPQQHVDNQAILWKKFCKKFNIQYDSFYRTSSPEHHKNVQIIWNRFAERGDIYKKKYSGKYCVGCESFKQEKELIDGHCPDHPTTVITSVNEENYFFKLSKYKDSLLNWINNNPNVLEPTSKLEELKNLIIDSDDISVSRLKTTCSWGVEVPNDSEQIIYLWWEALWNYPLAAGYLTDKFNWDNVIQFFGADNLRFQAVIFQAFLESEGIKKTDKLLTHGTILDSGGRKMSKTVGNVVDPIEQLNKYGVNPVRFYALRGLNTYGDSSWDENELKALWNSEIVNDWGNLIARTLHLIDTKCDKKVPYAEPDVDFSENVTIIIDQVHKLWSEYKIKEALQKTNEIIKFANKYINDERPWSSGKHDEQLSNLYWLINHVNALYSPVIPDTYVKVLDALSSRVKTILFEKIL